MTLAPVDVVRGARPRILPQTEAERAAQIDSLLVRWIRRLRFGTVADQGPLGARRPGIGNDAVAANSPGGTAAATGHRPKSGPEPGPGRVRPCGTSGRSSCGRWPGSSSPGGTSRRLFGLGKVRAAAVTCRRSGPISSTTNGPCRGRSCGRRSRSTAAGGVPRRGGATHGWRQRCGRRSASAPPCRRCAQAQERPPVRTVAALHVASADLLLAQYDALRRRDHPRLGAAQQS